MFYIYKTTNLINNKIYIGQHKAEKFEPSYKGSGKIFQEALSKYGKNNFKVELIEFCNSSDQADIREKYWIAFYNSTNLEIGYNILKGGQRGSFTGCVHNEDSKSKMRESHIGKEFSEEHKRNISINKTGTHYIEGTGEKISKSLKEKYLKEKRVGLHTGYPLSAETKKKISEWHSGRKLSEETKKKMSESRIGMKYNKN